MKEYLTFDDVQILPSFSDVKHRGDVDTSTYLTENIKLSVPLLSSPMDTITEFDMATKMGDCGGLGVIHRFMSIPDQVQQVQLVLHKRKWYKAAAVGVTDDYLERATELVAAGVTLLVIDVSHGDHEVVYDAVETIKTKVSGDYVIMAGSVATGAAAGGLVDCGADIIRVGVGCGSLCTTRIRTGVGVPQISALLDVRSSVPDYIGVVADGGVRCPGDVAKAIAAGADAVMLGGLLAGTKETPGHISKQGNWPAELLYKRYQGSASLDSKQQRGELGKNVEGASTLVPYKGKVSRIVNDITDGLRSAMSFVGANDINKFQKEAELIRITPSGLVEAQAHGMGNGGVS